MFEKTKAFVAESGVVFDKWLEPSAGSGAFYSLLPADNRVGVDIDPKIEGVVESNFFDFDLGESTYFTVGNPPFGKNSSLAIRFFNRCAKHSVGIAFIVPKTFKKDSVKDKLDMNFHLVYEEDVAQDAFNRDGEVVHVPCVFQIWLKMAEVREKAEKRKTADFLFVSKNEDDFDVYFQRVGVNAGRVKPKDSGVSDNSHMRVKVIKKGVIDVISGINWDDIKHNTAGNPSISKNEMIKAYIEAKGE
jgi:hypothetical protein